jgi:hypothetical protein
MDVDWIREGAIGILDLKMGGRANSLPAKRSPRLNPFVSMINHSGLIDLSFELLLLNIFIRGRQGRPLALPRRREE